MSRTKMAGLLAVSVAMMLAVPSLASAATISSAGAVFTGAVNARQVSSTATLVAPTGTITCNNATGTNPRLGSFGTGNVTVSNVTSTPANVGTLSRLSFGNQLLAVGGGVVHNSTTSVLTSGAPNATPRCTSTIPAISGGCVAETASGSSVPVAAYTPTTTTGVLRLTLSVNLYCKDSSGNNVNCTYSTGSGSSAPVESNPFALNTGGSTAPSTAVFSNVAAYRSAGSTLCPPGGPVGSANAIKFSSSYQLFSGTVYPGGSGVYLQ